MENIFEKNIEFIKKYGKNIDIDKLDYLDNEKFIVEKCGDGESYTIKGKYKDGYVYFHSMYEPEREGEILAKSIIEDSKIGTLFVNYGFGFGYKFKHLLDKLDEETIVFIIEPDFRIFNFAIRYVDITKILRNDKIVFIIDQEVGDLKDIFKECINAKNIDIVEGLASKAYVKLYDEKYEDYCDIFMKILYHAKMTKNTLCSLSKIWFENSLKNLKYTLDGIDAACFQGILSGRPAILVSSGPSLDKNVHLLKNLQRKVFIIAAYTTISTLLKHEIVPDMYVSVDGRQIVYPTPKNYPFDMPLLCESTANHCLLKAHKGKKVIPFTLLDAFFIDIFKSIDKEMFLFNIGESVACIMLDFLFKAGADPIIFIGQDMSFPDGKNHTEGYYIFGDEDKNEESNNVETMIKEPLFVEDIYGGKVPTSHAFLSFLTWFNSYTKHNKDKVKFVDATEGGAKIDNTEICTFQEAIDKYCKNTEETELPNILNEIYGNSNIFTEDEKSSVYKILKDTYEILGKVDMISEEGIIYSEKLERLYKNHKEPESKNVIKILHKFKKIDAKLDELKTKTTILDLAFQDVIMEINDRRDRNVSEGLDIAIKTKLLYKSYLDVNKFARTLFEEALKDMEKGVE